MRPPRRLSQRQQERAQTILEGRFDDLTSQFATTDNEGEFIYEDIQLLNRIRGAYVNLPRLQRSTNYLSRILANDRDDRSSAFDRRIWTLDSNRRQLKNIRRRLPPATWWNFGVVYDWIDSIEAQIDEITNFLFQPVSRVTRTNRGLGYLRERARFDETNQALVALGNIRARDRMHQYMSSNSNASLMDLWNYFTSRS